MAAWPGAPLAPAATRRGRSSGPRAPRGVRETPLLSGADLGRTALSPLTWGAPTSATSPWRSEFHFTKISSAAAGPFLQAGPRTRPTRRVLTAWPGFGGCCLGSPQNVGRGRGPLSPESGKSGRFSKVKWPVTCGPDPDRRAQRQLRRLCGKASVPGGLRAPSGRASRVHCRSPPRHRAHRGWGVLHGPTHSMPGAPPAVTTTDVPRHRGPSAPWGQDGSGGQSWSRRPDTRDGKCPVLTQDRPWGIC